MSFSDWYEFVDWGWNDETPKEKANRAHRLWIDCQYSISRGIVTFSMKSIVKRLFDSEYPEAALWMTRIATAVGNIDIFGEQSS